jgi:hypothetical protein
MGRSQSRSGRGSEEKNYQPLSGLEPPIMQPVAQRYTIELSRLRVCIYYNGKGYSFPCAFNRAPRHEGVLREWRHDSTHSLTSALEGGE